MADALTLYDSPGSPCARRVRAVLLRHPRVVARPAFARSEGVRPD